ncbi:MAG TPA: FUSC family protein, partial [Ktedonobacteraceae bacterium]|nr:FUSC family protein [Ktedonobacteraceae bacterium]
QTSDNQEEIWRILPYCTALLAELHIARKLAVSWRYARQYWPVRIHFPYPRPPHLHLEDTWTSIRANLTLHSSAFRHAIRLGIALALATALYQVFHLPVERGYWIPMTVVLVLRSDFLTTFTRGIARLLGTMLGAVLTTLLVVFLAPSQPVLVAIITIAAYLMYSTLFANYAIFSVAVTMAAVFLISFTTPQTLMTAVYRAIDTAIGGVLALLMYALWPTWEQFQVPENIAKRLEALGHYVNAVMQLYANPDEQQTHALDKLHMQSRLARSNALGSVRRSLQEPKAHRVDTELAEGLLGAADNIARSALTLEAYFHDNPRRYALPEIAIFSRQVDEAMSRLAAALREGQQATALPDLPAALRALQAAVKAKKQVPDEARAQWHFLIAEAKRIVANIQAIQQLLSTGSLS